MRNRENKTKIFWKCARYNKRNRCLATAVTLKTEVPHKIVVTCFKHRHDNIFD